MENVLTNVGALTEIATKRNKRKFNLVAFLLMVMTGLIAWMLLPSMVNNMSKTASLSYWTDGLTAQAYGTETWLGSGTQEDAFKLASALDLAQLAVNVNAGSTYEGMFFELTNELNLAHKLWTPIGTYANPFMGTFNGNNNRIYYMSIIGKYETAGLFGRIYEAELENVAIVNAYVHVSTTNGTGSVVGTADNSNITSCTNDSMASEKIGFLNATSGNIATESVSSINNWYSQVVPRGYMITDGKGLGTVEYENVEGLLNESTVIDEGEDTVAGGIVGKFDRSDGGTNYVQYCWNTGSVSATNSSSAGGIVGWLRAYQGAATSFGESDAHSRVKNCANAGKIAATATEDSSGAGGIVGYQDSAQNGAKSATTAIYFCYNLGELSGYYVGGITGYAKDNDGTGNGGTYFRIGSSLGGTSEGGQCYFSAQYSELAVGNLTGENQISGGKFDTLDVLAIGSTNPTKDTESAIWLMSGYYISHFDATAGWVISETESVCNLDPETTGIANWTDWSRGESWNSWGLLSGGETCTILAIYPENVNNPDEFQWSPNQYNSLSLSVPKANILGFDDPYFIPYGQDYVFDAAKNIDVEYSSIKWDLISDVGGVVKYKKSGSQMTITPTAVRGSNSGIRIRYTVVGTMTTMTLPYCHANINIRKGDGQVSFSSSTTELTYGENYTFKATSSTGQSLTWSKTGNVSLSTTNGVQSTVTATSGVSTATITVTAEENEFYKEAKQSVTITLAKASGTLAVGDITKTYGDADFEIKAETVEGVEISTAIKQGNSITLKNNIATIKSAGDTIVTVTILENDYYQSLSKDITIKVNKAQGVVSFTSYANSLAYDSEYTFKAETNSDSKIVWNVTDGLTCTVSADGKTATIKAIKGEGTETVTISVSGSSNVTDATKSETIELGKMAGFVTASNIEKTYGDADFELSAISNHGGTLTFEVVSGSCVKLEGNKATILSAGIAQVKITCSATNNYGVASTLIEILVNKAESTIDFEQKFETLTYNKEYAFKAETNSDSVIKWSLGAGLSSESTNGENISIFAEKGTGNSTITISVAESINYLESSKTLTVSFAKADAILSFTNSLTTMEYDSKYTFVASTNSGEEIAWELGKNLSSDKLKGNSVEIKAISGTGTSTVKINTKANDFYKAGSKEITITLSKAEGILEIEDIEKVESDSPFEIIPTKYHGGTLSYEIVSGDSIKLNGNTATIKSEGNTVVKIVCASNENYDKAEKTITIKVFDIIQEFEIKYAVFTVDDIQYVYIVMPTQSKLSQDAMALLEEYVAEGMQVYIAKDSSVVCELDGTIVNMSKSALYSLKLMILQIVINQLI